MNFVAAKSDFMVNITMYGKIYLLNHKYLAEKCYQ